MDLPLRTERLVLRALTLDDLDDHQRLFSRPEVVRYLYEEPLDLEAAREHLERRLPAGPPGEGEWRNLAVEHEGRFLGEVGICLVSVVHRHCEVGYVFLPEAGGQGYATEAAAAMVQWAFDDLGAHRVTGRLDARNEGSAGVLRRLGMRQEAYLVENEWVKDEWTDERLFAITEDEWRGLHA